MSEQEPATRHAEEETGGGEEVEALRKAGIEVEVIPGITAGTAVPATLGIPVTHREFARGVTFVTGHTKDGAEPDWHALARTGTTLVVYMGGRTSAEIAARLIDNGLHAATPVVAVADVARADERRLSTTLAAMRSGAIRDWAAASAVVIGIGQVFDAAGVSRQAAHEATATARLADEHRRAPATDGSGTFEFARIET